MIAAIVAVVVAAGPANAHAFLVNTSPQAGDRLDSPPDAVDLQFSEPIVRGSATVKMKTAGGEDLAIDDLELTPDGTRIRAHPQQLKRGVYVVIWKVLSEDAHVETGEFAFGVDVTGEIASEGTPSSSFGSWADTTAMSLLLLGLVVAIGGLVSERWVWAHVPPQDPLAPKAPVTMALGIAAAGSAWQLVLAMTRIPGNDITRLFVTRSAALSLAQLAFITVSSVLVLTRLRRWALLPLFTAAAASAWRGHSGTSSAWWAAPSNALHVVLAGLWVGALVHLILVLWRAREIRQPLAAAAQRYATMALTLLPPLIALGVATALAEFTTLDQVISTAYGRMLLLKLALVTVALLLALVARLRALNTDPPKLLGLRRLTSAEGGVLAAVVIVTAVLANTAPPRGALASTDLLGPPPVASPAVRLAERVGEISVYIAAAPDLLRIEVKGSGDEPVDADLQVSGVDPEGQRFNLYPRRCGTECFTMEFRWQPGTTRLSATLSGKRHKGGSAEFFVPWPAEVGTQRMLDRIVSTMRRQGRFTLKEGVTSTGGDPPLRPFPVTGEFFASQEMYAAGGVVDISYLPARKGLTSVSFYLPGSSTWYRLWFDRRHRLQRELIINDGHRIERRFDYAA